MSQPLLTGDGLFHCSGQVGKGSNLELSIIQRQEVLQSTASLLADHALKAEGRDRYPTETVTRKLSAKGCKVPNSLVGMLRKKVTAKFHRPWHTQKNPLKRAIMSSLYKSPLSQIHHLHCSFWVQFNWPKVSPDPGLKKPYCHLLISEVRGGEGFSTNSF